LIVVVKRSRTETVSYRFQRTHHRLDTGAFLTTKSKRVDPVCVHFAQGDLDSACGIHVVSAALVILDVAKSVSLQHMSHRKFGVPAVVWSALSHTFFTGVEATDLVAALSAAALPISLCLKESTSGGIDGVIVEWLMRGELVALVIQDIKHPKERHWTLAVGIEGVTNGQKHGPDTILLLDPSGTEPVFRAYNARLRLEKKSESMGVKPLRWRYESPDFAPSEVHVAAAVRFRAKTNA
jgi:hypothetical protein